MRWRHSTILKLGHFIYIYIYIYMRWRHSTILKLGHFIYIYVYMRWKAELYNEFQDKYNQRHGLFR